MHLSLLLDMAADAMGDRRAVTAPEGELTFAELRDAAVTAAGVLGEPGGRTVQLGVNSLAVPIALLAASQAGTAFTPLNYRLADADLRRIAERAAPAVAIVDDDMVSRLDGVEGLEIITKSELLEGVTGGEVVTIPETEDVLVMLFTSGTTGEPKAALLRHRHVTSYVFSTLDFASADEDEAALVSVPPYHIAGISSITSSMYVGRRVVYLPAFTPEAWVAAAAAESITHAMVVPTMLGRVLDVIEATGERLPALRHLSYGGGRMPVEVIERALTLLPGVDFVNAYGLTETSSTLSVLAPDDHREAIASDDPAVRRRLGSVGRPHGAVEVSIRDPFGIEVEPGQSGEIWVRGDQVSGEYAGKADTLTDGWFPTRDGGWIDEGGYLFVTGRLDDVIVRGGENISPGEIEDVIRTFAGVEDVAVVGISSQEWGEDIVAFVVTSDPEPDESAVQTYVRERLRSSKVPARVEFRDELPYNETGKLLRRILKAEAAPLNT